MSKLRPFCLIHGADLANDLQPTTWLIEDFLEANTLALLHGVPGAGKTFVAIDMAMCVATGQPWHGHDVEQGSVVYIAGEGHEGIKRRLRAWTEFQGRTFDDSIPIWCSNRGLNLLSYAAAIEAVEVIDEVSKQVGSPSLIVIDTLARNFLGDENSSQDMSKFLAHVDMLLRHKYSATVLVVHHPSKRDTSQGRGSSALWGAVDVQYKVSDVDELLIELEPQKMKDAEKPDSVHFRLAEIELPVLNKKGKAETSLVVDCPIGQERQRAANGEVRLSRNQAAALRILHRLHAEQSSTYEYSSLGVAVSDWKCECTEAGIPKSSFYDCRDHLLKVGHVEIELGHARPVSGD